MRRLVMVGTLKDSNVGGDTIDIWSCTINLLTDGTAGPLAVVAAQAAGFCEDYVQHADTQLSPGVALDSVKFNEWDVATNKQINPITVEIPALGVRGGGSGPSVTFMSARVSLDDGTRNRHTKGGFFLPRVTAEVGYNGKFTPAAVSALAGITNAFLADLNSLQGHFVGVYSPTLGQITTSTRVRIGNVPDYISRRKNALTEDYTTSVIP